MWRHYGSKIMGVFLGPLSEALSLTIDILWWYGPFLYGRLCPIYFSRVLGFNVVPYLCSKFRIFNGPILE
jgi:hypothetical protein